MNDHESVTITVSSEDVIGAYKEQVSRLSEENALLNAQVRKLLRDRQLGVVGGMGGGMAGERGVGMDTSELDAWNDVQVPLKGEIVS